MLRQAAILALFLLALIPYTAAYTASTQPAGQPRTAAVDNDTTYYFLHITDLHLGSGSADTSKLEAFATQVKQVYAALPIKPLAVINTGDIADNEQSALNGVYSYYRSTLDLGGTGIERLDTAGNHDVYTSREAALWRSSFGNATYKYDVYIDDTHYVRYIALNTTSVGKVTGGVSTELLDQVEAWINEAEQDPGCVAIWLFGHHPPAPNTNENIDQGGWDYKATPFNDIVRGDPWRFVRMITEHEKVMGYIAGHVHESYVSYHYGKIYITTAPLTLKGPWRSSVSANYTGQGYVYRVVFMDHGVFSTSVFPAGAWPIAMITYPGMGSVLSGTVTIHAFAVSASGIDSVKLYIDDNYYGDMQPLNVSSKGGLYTITIDLENAGLSEGQHYFSVLVASGDGYGWSSRLYWYLHVSGGVYWSRSSGGDIAFLLRENYPMAWLKIYTENTAIDFPYASLYVPVSHTGGSIRVKALTATEHIPYNMRMRFALVTAKQPPSPSEDTATNMLRLVAGQAVEKNDVFPYDLSGWRQGSDPTQWWGTYTLYSTYSSGAGTWLQNIYTGDTMTCQVWLETQSYQDARSINITGYIDTGHDYDDMSYAVFIARSDPGYYSQAMIAYLEVEDSDGLRKYNMAPGILGIPVRVNITDVERAGEGYDVTVSIATADGQPVTSGKLVIQGSSDTEHWVNLGEVSLDGNSYTTVTVNVPAKEQYYRAVYVPSYDPAHPYSQQTTGYAAAVSPPSYYIPGPIPEPQLPIIIVLPATIAAIALLVRKALRQE